MIDFSFVPETLDWCKQHYTPPIPRHITCPRFGDCDGTDGTCWWCREMTPYQHEMCCDERRVRAFLSPGACVPVASREEAAEFIEQCKQESCGQNHGVKTNFHKDGDING